MGRKGWTDKNGSRGIVLSAPTTENMEKVGVSRLRDCLDCERMMRTALNTQLQGWGDEASQLVRRCGSDDGKELKQTRSTVSRPWVITIDARGQSMIRNELRRSCQVCLSDRVESKGDRRKIPVRR